jgi:hypothetical protein
MDKAMRTARLFTFTAAGFVVLAPFWKMKGRTPGLDLYIHDVYFVIPKWIEPISKTPFGRSNLLILKSLEGVLKPALVTLIAAAICGMFGLLYFGCGRLLRIPLNRGLSLANFLLIVLPLGTLILELYLIHPIFESGSDSWVIKFFLITYFAWMICFIIGCMLFVINFSWTLVRVVRTRA